MDAAQMWWYTHELKRKQMQLESERDRVKYWLERAQDVPTKRRLERELEVLDLRLNKTRRGLLF